jgi:hypothetical protein
MESVQLGYRFCSSFVLIITAVDPDKILPTVPTFQTKSFLSISDEFPLMANK